MFFFQYIFLSFVSAKHSSILLAIQKSRVRFDTSYLMPHIQLITKSRLVLLGNIYCESIPQPPSPPLPPSLRPHLFAGIQSPNWSVSMENSKYIQKRRRVVGGAPMYSSPLTTITTKIRLSLLHQYSSCAPPAPHPLDYFEINLCIRVICSNGCCSILFNVQSWQCISPFKSLHWFLIAFLFFFLFFTINNFIHGLSYKYKSDGY